MHTQFLPTYIYISKATFSNFIKEGKKEFLKKVSLKIENIPKYLLFETGLFV